MRGPILTKNLNIFTLDFQFMDSLFEFGYIFAQEVLYKKYLSVRQEHKRFNFYCIIQHEIKLL